MARQKLDEFSWLVGYLDGEGSFNNSACGGKTKKLRPYIHVASTDYDLINHAASLLNGKVHGPYHYNTKHKPYWKTQLSGKKAVVLMKDMLPFLCQRRQDQVRKVLSAHGEA